LELLDTQTHRLLRVRPASGAGRHFVQIVPGELPRIAARAPVVLTKHPETGRFYIGAVYGFAPGENLLVGADGAIDGATPLDWEREAFFVEGEAIAVDPAHPRFAGDDGRRLFDDGGEPTDALRRVQRALAQLDAGLRESDALVDALLAAGVVEPVDVSLSFDDGARVRLEGLYTVSRDALSELPDADVLRLFRAGQLQLALTVADSLQQQLPLLARRRNDRLAAA
jgi:hypothetical protein